MSAVSPQATADADLGLARMTEMSADVRGCAILDSSGAVMAASGAADAWGEAGASLLRAADAAGGQPARQAHVATEEGEVFAVREGGLAMVAVAERFTLASLMLFDMRTVLRDLAGGDGVPDRRKPHPRELASEAPEGPEED
jgi:hypothetical protein